MIYRDRRHAGAELGRALQAYAERDDVLVLALPRGGVPVGYEVARALGAPLDVFVVRKLGVPGHEELAMGAIASGGVRVLGEQVIRMLGIDAAAVDSVAMREQAELHRREHAYRGDRGPLDVRDRVVIVVDDGLATGSTMRAALQALRRLEPARLVAAVPVAAHESCEALRGEADEIVCAQTPLYFRGVGQWYDDFSQTSDAEVRELLAAATPPPVTGAAPRAPAQPPPAR